jgi:hypothetical protein
MNYAEVTAFHQDRDALFLMLTFRVNRTVDSSALENLQIESLHGVIVA